MLDSLSVTLHNGLSRGRSTLSVTEVVPRGRKGCVSSMAVSMASAAIFAAALVLLPLAALAVIRVRTLLVLRASSRRTLAFLHPYCNDGGGGERVLWVAIRELLSHKDVADRWRVVVYTGDVASDDEIRAHALARFGVRVPPSVIFVRLRLRAAIEPKHYPFATLIFQAAGSLLLALEAVVRAPAHVLVDTTGLHFCLPLLRALGVPRLACYVHYPIISSDMLGAVASRRVAHNNGRMFAQLSAGVALKLAYYRALALAYRFAGRRSDATMANGSWTAGHLRSLWGAQPAIVFPPCDTLQLQALPLCPPPQAALDAAASASVVVATALRAVASAAAGGLPRGRLVLSVAQFRPEKDHALQLRAFARLLDAWRAAGAPQPRPLLVLAGAVRHADDERRLKELRELSARLLGDDASAVLFAPNLPYAELRLLLAHAAVGLHTMWNEHFGIGVVEMLAAGVATIAHRSGGPALDIIEEGATGLLASSDDEYADAMAALLLKPRADERRAELAAAGRASVARRFSEAAFADGLVEALRPVIMQ